MPVLSASTLVLPEGCGLCRDHLAPARFRDAESDRGYDFTTVAYDAVHLPERQAVVLVCPRLLNLTELLGTLTIDGVPAVRRRHRRHARYEEVWLDAPDGAPKRVALRARDTVISASISPRETLFEGRRVLVTMLKDEPLEWIRDWVLHAVQRQGADAVLIVDNGSRSYSSQELDAQIAALPGLSAHAVVPMPFPYGNIRVRGPRKKQSKFLQTAVINLLRLRFVAGAAAVLRLDVDELAVSSTADVFQAAMASRLGYLSLPGEWCYTSPDHTGEVRHKDHRWSADPPRTCHPKYCIVPDSPMGRLSWENHTIGPLALSWFFQSRDHRMLHCRMLTTNWRGGAPRGSSDFRLVPSTLATRLWGPMA